MGGFDYGRYLAAKVSVDDRALNRAGLAELRRRLPATPPRVLEVGAGIGTMPTRLIDWGVLVGGDYTLLELDRRLLDDARDRLVAWAAARGLTCRAEADGLQLGRLRIRFVEAELGAYLQNPAAEIDLVIANAMLDLLDLPVVLPQLLRLLAPGGSYWFTINYDGETIFSPDHRHDAGVLAAYNQDMDDRIRFGRPSGDSRTGRHLFGLLKDAGAPAVFAGASDWIVHADPQDHYPHDEEYFLDCILTTIEDALSAPQPHRGETDNGVSPEALAEWVGTRRAQLAEGRLVYLAHQLDFVGGAPD